MGPAVQGQPGGDPVAAAGAGTGLQGAAEQGRPLPHADEAVARPLAVLRAVPVVLDPDLQSLAAVADPDAGPGRGPACLSELVRASCTTR